MCRYVYVCVGVCIYIYVYMYVYVCECECMYIYIYILYIDFYVYFSVVLLCTIFIININKKNRLVVYICVIESVTALSGF